MILYASFNDDHWDPGLVSESDGGLSFEIHIYIYAYTEKNS